MIKQAFVAAGLVGSFLAGAAAQTAIVTGDRNTPLRPLTGDGDRGISNAVLRDQPEVRVLRVVVQPGGVRTMHTHDNVRFHLFIPISGSMRMKTDTGSTDVHAWQPVYMTAGTRHGFENPGTEPVEILEVFVR
jgi:mannose-6-phosphate isomerase-like protein (cupin superfamily)